MKKLICYVLNSYQVSLFRIYAKLVESIRMNTEVK